MAKRVVSELKDEEVVYMTDPDIEFVSLVSHAANRFPFNVVKEQKMSKRITYKVLVPTDMGQEKIKELSEKYGFSTEASTETDNGYTVYNQVDEKSVDVESRSLDILDEEFGIYIVTANKEIDFNDTMDIIDAMFAMTDVVVGKLQEPATDNEDRKDVILRSVQNFATYADDVLSEVKAEDYIDTSKLSLKNTVLYNLFKTDKADDIRSEARTPVYDSTEKEDWDNISKTMNDYIEGYWKFHPDVEREETNSVDEMPDAMKSWIASESLLGNSEAETFENLLFFPVVNPDTDKLNENALRAVISGRGSQAEISKEAKDSAMRKAYELLNSEFDAELEIPEDLKEESQKMDEKINEVKEAISSEYKEFFETKLEEIREESQTFISKETFDEKVKELKEEVNELKNTPQTRKGEPEEENTNTKQTKGPESHRYYTAV